MDYYCVVVVGRTVRRDHAVYECACADCWWSTWVVGVYEKRFVMTSIADDFTGWRQWTSSGCCRKPLSASRSWCKRRTSVSIITHTFHRVCVF